MAIRCFISSALVS